MFELDSGHEPIPTAIAFGSICVISILQIVLIILKLCGVLAWAWWIVMLPYISVIILSLIICVIAIPIIRYIELLDDKKSRRR